MGEAIGVVYFSYIYFFKSPDSNTSFWMSVYRLSYYVVLLNIEHL